MHGSICTCSTDGHALPSVNMRNCHTSNADCSTLHSYQLPTSCWRACLASAARSGMSDAVNTWRAASIISTRTSNNDVSTRMFAPEEMHLRSRPNTEHATRLDVRPHLVDPCYLVYSSPQRNLRHSLDPAQCRGRCGSCREATVNACKNTAVLVSPVCVQLRQCLRIILGNLRPVERPKRPAGDGVKVVTLCVGTK